ncbi:MAG TPA: PD-(D/E)XK nuclease family protein [Bryobacteraceae bacterium]|jgi:probable DNA repair protein|nr:PD-(D/E)XK nuclease family protein [Bryobacteraceae bacterium]
MRLGCPGLFSRLGKKPAIVTPSPLLAAVVSQQASAQQLAQGYESWQRTPVHNIGAWLSACWQQARYAAEVPSLLSPSQEQALWQSVIEQEHPQLFDPEAAASLARRASALIAEWNISPDGELWNDHRDGQQFQIWLRIFRRKCLDQGWMTRAELWNFLPRWLDDGVCNRGLTIFAAFETTTPALDQVQRALGSAALVEPAEPLQPAPGAPAKSFATFPEELEYAARFARAAFEQDNAESIAVLVPDLSANRAAVQRVFQDVFYPARTVNNVAQNSAFHITAAAPLSEHPIVANALLLLELARPRIHHADAGAILRSPFIAGASAERSPRALADLELRKRRDLDVSLRDLEAVSGKCPLLAPVWSAARRVLARMPKRAELPIWSEFIADLLKAAKWPGDAERTPQEQQLVERWYEAVSSLAALGLVFGRVTYDVALGRLRRLLSRIGMEQGDWLSPVQILDAKDAASLRFDRAIITGMSDEMWPPRVETSPLVPLRLQRAHQVPGSTPQGLLDGRNRLTRNLFQSAPLLLATYSGRLSPIAARLTYRSDADFPLWRGKLPRQSFPPASLDERSDTNAPAYAANEIARGGTGLIRSQSLCPFRAFAEYRLQAKAPEDACFGFDARDRGGFLHRALEFVWQALQTQQQLRSTPDHQLRAIVHGAVVQAVTDDESSPLHRLVSGTERERLEQLILDWLCIERARKQPFTVETVEQERYYDFPGLRLRLRVDRIDRLPNGKVLLIDYKSGKQSREKLKCPRPPEPQLLVYAAATSDAVDGVFFGELKPREQRAVGFSREKHFDGASTTVMKNGWDAFLQQAESEVERIASEFVTGHAAVDPLRGACQYCRIKPLCRVNEACGNELDQE